MRPSPIFLGLVGLTAAGAGLAWAAGSTVRPLAYAGVFVFVIAGWLVSLCLHEFGHAYTAWRFGDHDAAVRGYLTLEPHLSAQTQRAVAPAKQWGVFLLLFVLLSPVLSRWFFGIVYELFGLSGIPPHLSMAGAALTRFWGQLF